ncbi:MAG: Fmu (Sun) domain-containing protein [Chitinophagaceae bacterium]|nr:Fmu (Sun) domain-containing protein [Chitinophagaceae bacterium]
MAYYHSHLQTAVKIIEAYKGELPLSTFLKNFFSKDKKYGSKDRRSIAALCYGYYRVCKGLSGYDTHQKILAGVLLTTDKISPILEALHPGWNALIGQPFRDKIEAIKATRFFPFSSDLSDDIDKDAFDRSFLIQPRLFIRIRPNRLRHVEKKLQAANLLYETITENCLAFENSTRIEEVLELSVDYVVQDFNSQQTIGLVSNIFPTTATINVWDCCAASGGKSIMAVDVLKNVQLTVSDVRDTILANLHKRFKAAGIKNFHSFEADLAHSTSVTNRFAGKPFDLVICDAPCTGSGIWSRTPEQLAFFNPAQIDQYSQLQKKIAGNVISAIKKGGYLLYITCSVFKKENEEVVQFLLQNYPVTLVKMEVLKGYEMRADSMFSALLRVG